MRRGSVWFVGALAGVLLAGCSCEGDPSDGGIGPCEMNPPAPTCGEQCSSPGNPCPRGYYCNNDSRCTADCDPANPTVGCPNGRCSSDGRCLARADGSTGDPNVCADVEVQALRVTPTVIVIVDQSGSMTAGFGGSNRWDSLRNTLMAPPNGLIYALESSVRFGVALYSSSRPDDLRPENGPAIGMCPMITWVDPDIDNYDEINAVYGPARPIDETPTGQSIDAVLDRVLGAPDPGTDPIIFILATDGEPDTCEAANPQSGQPQTLAAVRRANEAGIRTYVISVGQGTVSSQHLQDVANAGLNRSPTDTPAPYWVAGDDAGLRNALLSIVNGELTCDLTLRGRIENLEDACTGRVELNGQVLECNGPNGWRATDASHIELLGTACDLLLSSPAARLEASFPCGVVLI